MACSRRRRRRRREDGAVEPEVATGPRIVGRRRFFKIILSDALESGKLGIPKSFLRRCGKDLSNSVLLKVPGGSTWTIELEKRNNNMVSLWKGWREFTEHYCIGHGHLIVFKYKGNSTFHVIIFNKSASEINYSSSSGQTSYLGSKLPPPNTEDVLQAEDLEDFTPRRRMRVEPHLPYSQLSPIYSPRASEVFPEPVFHGPTPLRPLTTPELANKFHSENPFFKLVIYQGTRINIPVGFVRQHIKKERTMVTLRYSDGSWLVKLLRNLQHHQALFSAGWTAFARENRLHVGDVCIFELIDRDDGVFNVSICRSAGGIEQSACGASRSELDFHGPAVPRSLISPELAINIDTEHPFFKMVIPRSYMSCLNIPVGFVRQHIKKERAMVTLRYSDGSWLVKILRNLQHRQALFSAGWTAFARENRLHVGDVCMFELIDRDDGVFNVSICCSAGGIEQSACRASHSEPDFHGPAVPRSLISPELAINIDTEHPYFKMVIPRSYMSCLSVPVGFAKQHIQENKQIATLRYSDRLWPVKLVRSRGRASGTLYLSFSAGWRTFARETHVRAGNVCVFELIDRDDTVFKVSILTGADNGPIHID
ncbi:B3 domain-containing protein LOC_Os12g40080-like [Syzygium oleosum]|uniref:B3 domain-containing protein LOC_Os12g40080-like n=1 Tax=Syzygium oleosum TaxID=219896 RepID=UPI0024BB56B5|nr:B3 domain-containing protein LOC_Os12g40080-like [Syzygium oleosum]